MQNRASDSNIVVIMQGKSKALQVHQWGFVYCIIRLRDSYFKASFYSIKLYFVSENVFFFMYSLWSFTMSLLLVGWLRVSQM